MADTNTVGSLALPIAAGVIDDALDDPTLLGLLAYVGHWLKESLDAKLAQQNGPAVEGAILDACPVEHRFPWNHGGAFMRPLPATGKPPLPGLWAYEQQATQREETMYWSAIERTIVVQYIFPELVSPSGMSRRSGLMGAVSRIMAKAFERGREASFGYDGAPLGQPLFRSLGVQSIGLVSCKPGHIEVIPGGMAQGTGRTNTSGTVHRFYPSVEATVRVVERIGHDTAAGYDQGDASFTFASGNAPGDAVDVLTRIATQDDAPYEDD